ncbi:MAG: hypothetical protein FWD61_16620 [Phycisphaerales bacterium]|nr:hypothetical protein [Phycisphaerales bacterium]
MSYNKHNVSGKNVPTSTIRPHWAIRFVLIASCAMLTAQTEAPTPKPTMKSADAFVLLSYTNRTKEKITGFSDSFSMKDAERSSGAGRGIPARCDPLATTSDVFKISIRNPDASIDELKQNVKAIQFSDWKVRSFSVPGGTIELKQ